MRWLGLAIGAAALGLALWFVLEPRSVTSVRYHTVPVSRGAITVNILASGTVNPVNLVSVGAQVTGTIESFFVDANDPVRKGQVIARIDPALFQAKVARAEADRAAMQTEVNRTRALVTDRRRTWKRLKALRNRQLVTFFPEHRG